MRREFDIAINFNGKKRHPLIVDSHFLNKHPDMNYEIVVELVKTLDHGFFEKQSYKDGWSYYAVEPAYYNGKPYRLILLTHSHEEYLGVINAFRVKRRKKHEI